MTKIMLLPVFQDLIKPQWRTVIEELKRSGGLPASELSRATDTSYMAAKTHCDELTKAGYVIRTRIPRSEVGRPEIFYSLSQKADALFPEAGVSFTLELLDDLKRLYGESAPEKLLFQYFQKKQETFSKLLDSSLSLEKKAAKLAKLREKDGCACMVESTPKEPIRLVELHNPLSRIFEHYPRTATIELRMIEELLGCRITRSERPSGREMPPQVVFELS